MELILFVGNDCQPCKDVEAKFRAKFGDLLGTKEAEVVNIDESEEAQQFWLENELPLAPMMIVVSESDKVIAVLGTDDLLNEAETPTPAGD